MVRDSAADAAPAGVIRRRRDVHVPSVANSGPETRVTSTRFATPGPGSASASAKVASPLKPLSTCDQPAPPLVDHAFDGRADTAKAMGIEEVLTAPRSPWQNAYVERFIGSARRECLDHVIVLSATGLQRLMHRYGAYYEQSRTRLSLNKDAPIPRPIAAPGDGRVVAIPQVGGLHHRYVRQGSLTHCPSPAHQPESPRAQTADDRDRDRRRLFREPKPFCSLEPHASSGSPRQPGFDEIESW